MAGGPPAWGGDGSGALCGGGLPSATPPGFNIGKRLLNTRTPAVSGCAMLLVGDCGTGKSGSGGAIGGEGNWKRSVNEPGGAGTRGLFATTNGTAGATVSNGGA